VLLVADEDPNPPAPNGADGVCCDDDVAPNPKDGCGCCCDAGVVVVDNWPNVADPNAGVLRSPPALNEEESLLTALVEVEVTGAVAPNGFFTGPPGLLLLEPPRERPKLPKEPNAPPPPEVPPTPPPPMSSSILLSSADGPGFWVCWVGGADDVEPKDRGIVDGVFVACCPKILAGAAVEMGVDTAVAVVGPNEKDDVVLEDKGGALVVA